MKLHHKQYLTTDFLIYNSFSSELVKFVFEICSRFGVNRRIKYMCLELFDLYLNKIFFYKYKKIKKCEKNWNEFLKQSKNQSSLRVLSCIQLVLKFMHRFTNLKLIEMKNMLHQFGQMHTINDIISSEVYVFHTIEYKLNEPSMYTFVEYFIIICGYDNENELLTLCSVISDFVYIYYQSICDSLLHKKGQQEFSCNKKVQILFGEFQKTSIAASIIITSAYLLNYRDETIKLTIVELAKECNRSSNDLSLLSFAIINVIKNKIFQC
ncbi:uncharacterized protein LOC126910255 isoform X2 [Daktulosphaira vitifoliae]|nr:uncharacterized protein LOC126910255 isoform X2 [Daktulosphaira vitifoliae]